MRERPVIIGAPDAERLRGLLAAQATDQDQAHVHELAGELERALVLDVDEVPRDVITMHARANVLDLTSGARDEWTLVFPAEADLGARRISVLAPLGTALLGYREGDEVEWEMPGGLRRLRVESVRQPKAVIVPSEIARQARIEGAAARRFQLTAGNEHSGVVAAVGEVGDASQQA